MLAVTVQPGQTLSGVAEANGASLSAVEAANPSITDPNLITVGETVVIPSGGNYTSWSPSSSPAQSSSPSSGGSSSGGNLSDVPGVPSSFAACVAFRESTDGTNPAARGNLYGIIPSSGYSGYGASVSQQKQMFATLYHEYGTSPWSPSDGC